MTLNKNVHYLLVPILFALFIFTCWTSIVAGTMLAAFLLVFALSLYYREKVFYALILLYPMLPVYFSFDPGGGLPLITASRLLLLYVIGFDIIFNRDFFVNVKQKIRNSKVNFAVISFLAFYILSFALGMNEESFKMILSVCIEYIIAAFYIYLRMGDHAHFEKVLDVLLLSAFILGILGIIEFATKNNIFGYLQIVKTDKRLFTNEAYMRLGQLRVAGPFGHALAYCNFLILVIPITIYKFFFQSEGKKRIKYILLFILLIVNFLLTLSRGPMLAILPGALLFFALLDKKKKSKVILVSIFAGSVFALAYVSGILPGYLKGFLVSVYDAIFMGNRVSNFGDNSQASVYRLYLFQLVKELITGNQIFFGRGIGFFRLNAVFGYMPFINKYKPIQINSVDNFYLLKYLEMGISGIVQIGILWTAVIYNCIRNIVKSQDNQFFICMLVITISYAICLFTVDEIGTMKFYWMVMGFFIYQLYHSRGKEVIMLSKPIMDQV